MDELNIPDEYSNIQMNSSTIIEYYINLITSILENDDENFKIYLELLKEIIEEEIQNYKKIDSVTAMKLLSYINEDDTMSLEVNRYYHRLKERADILIDMPKLADGTTLYTVINSKIIIDSFKKFCNKTRNNKTLFNNEKMQRYDEYLMMAAIIYFTDNTFLEQLTLKNNFDISKIPTITLEEIREMFQLDNNDQIEEMLCTSILASISNLNFMNKDMNNKRNSKNNENEESNNTPEFYEIMNAIDLIRIEIQWKLLNKNSKQELRKKIYQNYKNNNSLVMRRVKIILEKEK